MASLTFQSSFFSEVWTPQTRFSSNVVFIFQKSLNVSKDTCLDAKHVEAHLMNQLKKKCFILKAEKNKLNHSGCLVSQIIFHYFVCLYIYVCIFFLFYYPTLSLLCMFQSYNDNLFCGWTSSCFFYMTEHNYSVFCIQKQGSTKNVNANLSGNL